MREPLDKKKGQPDVSLAEKSQFDIRLPKDTRLLLGCAGYDASIAKAMKAIAAARIIVKKDRIGGSA